MLDRLITIGGFLLMLAGLMFIAAQNMILGKMLATMQETSHALLKLH